MPNAAVCPKKYIKNNAGPNGRRFTPEFMQYVVDQTRDLTSPQIHAFAKTHGVSDSSVRKWWQKIDPKNYPLRGTPRRKKKGLKKMTETGLDGHLIKEADAAVQRLMGELDTANSTIEALKEEVASLQAEREDATTITDATTLTSYFWMGISAAGGTEDPVAAMKVLRSINEHATN